MSSMLSLYYDGSIVQAVKVRVSGKSVSVDDASTFSYDDLDDYLATCGAKNCVISINPPLFYQDILNLPPAAAKLHHKLVRNEILSLHPDLDPFSVFHRPVGESTLDGRVYSKIAAFSYPDEFLSGFIADVNRFGIRIDNVLPTPYSIFRLAASSSGIDPKLPRIFVASLLGEKLLLVSENGELEFVRKMPSLDSALQEEDATNINMTIDYCFQSLRMRPGEIVTLGRPEQSRDLSLLVSVPVRSELPPQLGALPPHITQDYLAPIAAAVHSAEAPRTGRVVPAEYSEYTLQKRILLTATVILSILILLAGWNLINRHRKMSAAKDSIAKIRAELSGSAQDLAAFRKLDDEVNQLKQPLEVVNRHNLSLNPASALAALELPKTGEYTVKNVTVQSGEKGISVAVDGVLNAAGYSDTQGLFEKLVTLFGKIPGYTVTSSSVDIRQKSFKIQALFNNGPGEAK